MRGYIIVETTTKNRSKSPYQTITQTIIDNKVWDSIDNARVRILNIVSKKIAKHNYVLNGTNLSDRNEHKRYITIVRGNFDIVRRYDIRGMKMTK